ncbi:MAG: AI-2E family transporter [Gaiellales bacterium]|jgi:predicted PurR-regulated permease PerM
MSEPRDDSTAPTTVSVTSPISSRRVAMETQPQRVMLEVQARTVAKVLALVLAFSIVVSLLETVRTVIVWFGIALFLAVVLNPLVAFTERWMRRNIAVVVVFISFVVGLLAVLAVLVGPFVTQIDNIVNDAPHAADRLAKNPLIHRLDEQYNIVDKAKEHASELPTVAFGAAGSVISGVTETVTVLFLSAFILFELPRMTEIVLSQLRPAGANRARDIGAHINRSVGGYVVGNLFISVIAGVVATATVWALGVPYALTLGVVVAIGDLVPLVGATVASIIVVATAYFTQGTTAAIIVFVVVMVYQQIENHVIQPIVYRHTVQIPSLVVLIAVLAGASVLGIVGALVAIPIAGTVQVVVKDLLEERATRIATESAPDEAVTAAG